MMPDLIEKLKAATGPDREIDAWLHLLASPSYGEPLPQRKRHLEAGDIDAFMRGYNPDWKQKTSLVPAFTGSMDAAVSLIPPGKQWLTGAGRISPEEALYGATIYEAEISGIEIGQGETNANAPIAICIAALKARAAVTANKGGSDL